MRNGYEVKAKVPSFRPFALNTPGRRRQKAYAFPASQRLTPLEPLVTDEWTALGTANGLVKDGQDIKDFQAEAANFIIARRGDLCVIAPTGSGKSLLWMLPLLAQTVGISLVIIPYTSLGFQGEQRCERSIGTGAFDVYLIRNGCNRHAEMNAWLRRLGTRLSQNIKLFMVAW